MPALRHSTSSSPRKPPPHSSDTEPFETPVRRRYKSSDAGGSTPSVASSSSSTAGTPRKRQRKDASRQAKKEVDLEQLLRDVVGQPDSNSAVLALKTIPRDERATRALVAQVIHSAKGAVVRRCARRKDRRLLETELYYEWLHELEYVVCAFEIALEAKQPGTRRRVTGLGRASYTALVHLVDEFIDEVNAHHDRPHADAGADVGTAAAALLYPATLTLVEEARDPSTDARSDAARVKAEGALERLDSVLASAVRRYKAECGRANPTLAARVGGQAHALARGCCLLCEQTGYGAAEDDMGDVLLEHAREAMELWKGEYEESEDQLDESDAES
ncbi:hypothetical protein HYPSUDRAFT_77735 [Hypholoma sublateritium FD-334 SS-4]|uniref:Uncharacterized protein n=1 Tax=Hypholoma sublateritium (strain FD-334 SS-4) TaxID=945553 RepID=A0A0D2MDV8_HYPSF|nr:hypothetical protein HYPSUDRAFT_77735 [Hypholoma sublateritium FD-334 SS-4]